MCNEVRRRKLLNVSCFTAAFNISVDAKTFCHRPKLKEIKHFSFGMKDSFSAQYVDVNRFSDA